MSQWIMMLGTVDERILRAVVVRRRRLLDRVMRGLTRLELCLRHSHNSSISTKAGSDPPRPVVSCGRGSRRRSPGPG